MSLFDIQLSGGTIIGTDHKKLNKNNQDAFYYKVYKNFTVALVGDGCSGCKHSEVGSQIGVNLIAHSISTQVARLVGVNGSYLASEGFWKRVREDVLAYIRTLANQMSDSVSEIVSNYFLFTVVGTIISEHEAVFFSLGDGVLIVNGESYKLGPFEDNTPPYLAYGLIDTSLKTTDPGILHFKIAKRLPQEQLDNFLIGTDGVSDLISSADKTIPGKTDLIGSISQFWEEDIYLRNSEKIACQLNLINRDYSKIDWDKKVNTKETGRLPDDTTFIVGKISRKEV